MLRFAESYISLNLIKFIACGICDFCIFGGPRLKTHQTMDVRKYLKSILLFLACWPKVKKYWESEKILDKLLQTGPGLAGPGTKTRSAAQAAKSEKILEK